jgi:hypothetical protein
MIVAGLSCLEETIRSGSTAIGAVKRSLREITVTQLSLVTMTIPRERNGRDDWDSS